MGTFNFRDSQCSQIRLVSLNISGQLKKIHKKLPKMMMIHGILFHRFCSLKKLKYAKILSSIDVSFEFLLK